MVMDVFSKDKKEEKVVPFKEFVETRKKVINNKRTYPSFVFPQHIKIALLGLIAAFLWLILVDPNFRMYLYSGFLTLISAGTLIPSTNEILTTDINGVEYTQLVNSYFPHFRGWNAIVQDDYGWLPIISILMIYITIFFLVISYTGFKKFYKKIKQEVNMIIINNKKVKRTEIQKLVVEKMSLNKEYKNYSTKWPFKILINDGWIYNQVNIFYKLNWEELEKRLWSDESQQLHEQ